MDKYSFVVLVSVDILCAVLVGIASRPMLGFATFFGLLSISIGLDAVGTAMARIAKIIHKI